VKSGYFFIVAAVSGLLALSAPIAAQADNAKELRHAQAALSAGDYDKAYAQYKGFADKGNPLAQFTMAMFHQMGWGRTVDPVSACRWHEKAAAGKIPASAHYLADCLVSGTHMPPDPTQAAKWYEQAANYGHFSSLCALGSLYIAGNGVAKDPAKGLTLCQQAAQKGHVASMMTLGRSHLQGVAGKKDYQAAVSWFEQASQRNSAEAPYLIGTILREGSAGPKRLEEARYWFELAASRGYVRAYFVTGGLYFAAPPDPGTQMPTAKNLAKAFLWLSAAKARSTDKNEFPEIRKQLAKIGEIMPQSWAPDLEMKVAEHLAKYPAR
jgi:TPR repeat protein